MFCVAGEAMIRSMRFIYIHLPKVYASSVKSNCIFLFRNFFIRKFFKIKLNHTSYAQASIPGMTSCAVMPKKNMTGILKNETQNYAINEPSEGFYYL